MATPLTLILSGVPGRMCREIAQLAQGDARFRLAPYAIASPRRAGAPVEVCEGYAPHGLPLADALARARQEAMTGSLLVIDYTVPAVALEHLRAYAQAGVPFVMGTTGFDRAEAVRALSTSSTSAVVAPNMAAPIVLLQTLLNEAATRFPGALEGFALTIRESHQSTKKDASGTAKALLGPLTALGARPTEPAIASVRDPQTQRALGIPVEHLTGHGWHWYTLGSPAGDVRLELAHHVNGRRVYAEGTLQAALYLVERLTAGSRGEAFSMTDVLAAGR